jgi:hypothetical protein
MSVFYQLLFLDKFLFIVGALFLYDTKKHPKNNETAPYDVNYINKLRGLATLTFAVIILFRLIFWK